MKKNPKTLNEEINRMKSLFDFDFNYDNIIVEQTETKLETFDFSESYPDNIAFPVKPNASIKSTQDVLQEKNLNYALSEFITKLKTKIEKGTKIDTVKINSGASPEGANTNVPDGFDQSIVNYSFSNNNGNKTGDAFGNPIKMSVDNKTLATNRGNNMKVILTTLIPELKNANIEVKSDLDKKVVNIQIPGSIMVNFKTDPELSKEYVVPKSVYTPSFEKPSVVAGCNKDSKATGSAGAAPKYIADRVKLDVPENYTGNITFKYNSYLIPDRFQLIQVTGDKTNILQDTNFVSSAKGDTFNKLQNEVKTLGGELKSGGDGTLSFKAEAGSKYFIDVIAPFGGTYWSASLGCKTDIKPINWRTLRLDTNKEYIFYSDFVKNKSNQYNIYTENPDGNLKIISKGKFIPKANGPVLQDGSFFDQNGKEQKVKGGRSV